MRWRLSAILIVLVLLASCASFDGLRLPRHTFWNGPIEGLLLGI